MGVERPSHRNSLGTPTQQILRLLRKTHREVRAILAIVSDPTIAKVPQKLITEGRRMAKKTKTLQAALDTQASTPNQKDQ